MSNNLYLELKRKHEKEVNDFPMKFAFSDKQFEEAMKELGLEVTDTDKIYSIGAGGFIKKEDRAALNEMGKRHEEEMKNAIEDDITGEGFIFDMFNYELSNHEYCYTYDTTDTIYALGLTEDEINNNERLLSGLKKACKYQKENCE